MDEKLNKIVDEVKRLQALALKVNIDNIQMAREDGQLRENDMSVKAVFLTTIAMELSMFPDLYMKSTDKEMQDAVDYINNVITIQRTLNPSNMPDNKLN